MSAKKVYENYAVFYDFLELNKLILHNRRLYNLYEITVLEFCDL